VPYRSKSGLVRKSERQPLDLAEIEFDALVTVDTNLRYQQNLTGRKIAIVILRARSNRLIHLSPHFAACMKALQAIKPGEIIYVGTAS